MLNLGTSIRILNSKRPWQIYVSNELRFDYINQSNERGLGFNFGDNDFVKIRDHT